jgi:hypothetical protein
MKLDPIQTALVNLHTGPLKQKDLVLLCTAMSHAAKQLHTMAREQENQRMADCMSAGALALLSLADEIQAGGETQSSAEYLSRAISFAASYTIATHPSKKEEEDDDDLGAWPPANATRLK